jgi:hypothetical protein
VSCNLTRFYYCESNISLVNFLKRDHKLRNGIAFEDVETRDADALEQKLINENEDYLRVDL